MAAPSNRNVADSLSGGYDDEGKNSAAFSLHTGFLLVTSFTHSGGLDGHGRGPAK